MIPGPGTVRASGAPRGKNLPMDERRAASYPFIPTATVPPVVESADGCTLYFSDGREVIDAGGGAVAVNIGHGRAEVAEAVAEATRRVSYVIPPWVTEERITLVEMLRERWLPPGLDRVGIVSGGSESVDSAIRLAINHFVSKGQPERWKVIGRETSYHGVTLASLAVGGHTSRRSGFEHVLMDHPKMPVADAEGRFPLTSEVIADPHRKAHPPELLAAAGLGEHHVFPGFVEESPPRPVEVDGEPDGHCRQAEPIRGAAIDESDPVNRHRRAEYLLELACVWVERGTHHAADDCRIPRKRQGFLAGKVGEAEVKKEGSADAAEYADRGRHRFD